MAVHEHVATDHPVLDEGNGAWKVLYNRGAGGVGNAYYFVLELVWKGWLQVLGHLKDVGNAVAL